MMNNDRRGRLLRLELKFFRQLNIDARRIEQLKQFGLIFEIRTSGIAKTESRTLIALTKQFIKIFLVSVSDTQLLTNVSVPILGQCFGAFHAEAVKKEIVGVVVSFEKFLRIFAGATADCHQVKRNDIHVA